VEAAAQGAVVAAQEVLEEFSKIGRANMLDYIVDRARRRSGA